MIIAQKLGKPLLPPPKETMSKATSLKGSYVSRREKEGRKNH